MEKSMLIIILVITSVSSLAFVANDGGYLKGGAPHRIDIEEARPRPDRYYVTTSYKLDLKEFEIGFYENSDLKGRPSIVWNKKGVSFKGKLLCGWIFTKDGKPMVDSVCPEGLPFGTFIQEVPLDSNMSGESIGNMNKHHNIHTQIEVVRFENVPDKKYRYDFKGDIGVVEYRSKEYYFNYKRLEKNKWGAGASHISLSKKDSLENMKMPSFLKFINRGRECVENKDAICLALITSKELELKNNRVSGEKIVKTWEEAFKEREHGRGSYYRYPLKELQFMFNNMRFPCVSVYYYQNPYEMLLSGERFYIVAENLKMKEKINNPGVRDGRKKPTKKDEWKITRFINITDAGYPDGMKYCEVKIQPVLVPTPTLDASEVVSMRLYEWKICRKELKEGSGAMSKKEWIDAYLKLYSNKGEGLSRKEWSIEYQKRGYRILPEK